MKRYSLTEQWRLKMRNPACALEEDLASAEGWLAVRVPGTVHQDLLAAGIIPDPFFGRNELEVQWVGEQDWLYHCTFDAAAVVAEATRFVLSFDGLDTFVTVWLNGTQILASENMFVPQRVDVAALLQPANNQLALLFESALRRGKELEAEHGAQALWNGDSSRLYVRKAQYHYGWDWGPVLLTVGPWRGIHLEAYDARIAEIHSPIEVATDLSRADLAVHLDIESMENAGALEVHLRLYDPVGSLLDEARILVRDDQVRHQFVVDTPALWWPHSYGEQPLYRVVADLQEQEAVVDTQQLRVGIRRVQLVQNDSADQEGQGFCFKINNLPIFCGGANWIPADSFIPRLTPERYRAWLQLVVEANMTMLRVWGGGIYEEACFYDLCDELGILVWQDFLFACGIYPAHASFQESVRAEAEAALRRLRYHAGIVKLMFEEARSREKTLAERTRGGGNWRKGPLCS